MGLLAAGGVSQLLLLMALVLIVGTTLLRTQRYFSRQRSVDWRPAQPAGTDTTAVAAGVPRSDQLAAWEVHMHQTARDLAGQLDSKMRALEILIHRANQAAARLEQALAQVQQHDASVEPEGESAQPAARWDLGPDAAEPTRVLSGQAEALQAAVEQAGQTGTCVPRQAADDDSTSRRRDEVYVLADYGFPSVEIARRVGVPVGEVELMLRLRNTL